MPIGRTLARNGIRPMPVGRGGVVTPVVAPVVAAGGLVAFVTDGLGAPGGGVGTGVANPVHRALAKFGWRLQPVPVPMLGMSGTTIARDISSNRTWINPTAINAMAAQVPDVWGFGPYGANDNVLSIDPGPNPGSGTTTNIYLQDWYDSVAAGYAKFTALWGTSATNGKRFLVVPTVPSNKTGEVTYRATVYAAMASYVANLAASDSRVLFAPLTGMIPATGYSGSDYSADTTGSTFIGNCSISNTTLTVNSTTSGSMAIGRILTGTAVIEGTTVTGGSGTTWTVNISQNLTSRTMYGNVLWVHSDQRGAEFVANAIFTALDSQVATLTTGAAMDMIDAGTYPLQVAANGDTDTGLTGTGGTVTASQGMTGSIATSKLISNTTGATGIVVSQVATTGGRTKTSVALAGTTTADGKIIIQDRLAAAVTQAATPGQPIRTGAIYRVPAGFRNIGAEWNNIAGWWGGGATSLIENTRASGDDTVAVDALIFNGTQSGSSGSLPNGQSTSFTGKRSLGIFYKSGTALTGTIECERWFYYRPSNRTAGTPVYLGDVSNSQGVASGPLLSATYRLRPTGTVTNASGGTIRVEPGLWSHFGLTEADFITRRIYAGGGSGGADNRQNTGTGTLLATLTTTNWTFAAAAGITAGTLIYVEIDVAGVTYRSTSTITVG